VVDSVQDIRDAIAVVDAIDFGVDLEVDIGEVIMPVE
jgi:hypothetical protein